MSFSITTPRTRFRWFPVSANSAGRAVDTGPFAAQGSIVRGNGRLGPKIAAPARRRRTKCRQLSLELCESRELLAVFTVTSPLDTGAVGELRWAITSANTTPGPDQINFAAQVNQVQLSMGELAITDPVEINGSPAAVVPTPTIQASPNSRIFRIDDSNPNTEIPVRIAHLSLTGGNVSAFPASGQGGAILNLEQLDLERCHVRVNQATAGGGIANQGRLTVRRSEISGNTATVAGGGGLWNAPQASAEIMGGVVDGNVASSGFGGGILNRGGATLSIGSDAAIRGNLADSGGGGIATQTGAGLQLAAVRVESNGAPLGGGILIDGLGSTLTALPMTRVQSNQAVHGGGLAVADHGLAVVRGSTVIGNEAQLEGGGIHVSGSELRLVASEVTANQIGDAAATSGNGGGIFANDGATVSLDGSVISANGALAIETRVRRGGGIYVGGGVQLTVDSSSVSGNVAFHGGGVYATSSGALRPRIYISNSNLDGNAAYFNGGAIDGRWAVDLELKCVTITGNAAHGANGGGLHLGGGSGPLRIDAIVRDSVISENVAGQDGGGISSEGDVELSVSNSIVSRNRAFQQRRRNVPREGNQYDRSESNECGTQFDRR